MSEVNITITEGKPYKIEGAVSITAIDSYTTPESPIYLCSCGQSNKKPYCDGSHNDLKEKENGS